MGDMTASLGIRPTGLELYSTGPYSGFVERSRSFGRSAPYLVLAKQPAGAYPHLATPELWIGVQVAGRGNATFELGGARRSSCIEPGDILLRQPGVESYYEFDHTHTFLLMSIPLTPDFLSFGENAGVPGLCFGALHDRKIADSFVSAVVRQLWFEMQTESVEPLQYLSASARYLILELTALMHRSSQRRLGGLAGHKRKKVLEYIHFNLDQRISVQDLATLSSLSEFHFSRAFKQTFGVTPHRYLVVQRIEKAKDLLTASSLSLSEIAGLVGYGRPETLHRAFRAEGLPPPQKFRKLR